MLPYLQAQRKRESCSCWLMVLGKNGGCFFHGGSGVADITFRYGMSGLGDKETRSE